MGKIRDTLDNINNTYKQYRENSKSLWSSFKDGAGGLFNFAKTTIKNIPRAIRTKSDQAQNLSFLSNARSLLKRIKAYAINILKKVFDSLNKQADSRAKATKEAKKNLTKDLKKYQKKGLNIDKQQDIHLGVKDKTKGRNSIVEQKKRNKNKTIEKSTLDDKSLGKSLTKDNINLSKTNLNKGKSLSNNVKDIPKGIDDLISKATKKQLAESKAKINYGLNTKDLNTKEKAR